MTFFLPQFLSTWKTLKFYSNVRVDSPRQVIIVNECKYNAVGRGSAFSTHERNLSTTQIDVKHWQMFTEKKKSPSFCQSPCLLFLIEAQDIAHAERKRGMQYKHGK